MKKWNSLHKILHWWINSPSKTLQTMGIIICYILISQWSGNHISYLSIYLFWLVKELLPVLISWINWKKMVKTMVFIIIIKCQTKILISRIHSPSVHPTGSRVKNQMIPCGANSSGFPAWATGPSFSSIIQQSRRRQQLNSRQLSLNPSRKKWDRKSRVIIARTFAGT